MASGLIRLGASCCGASNISFGLPQRAPLNGAFLAMAITTPIEPEIKQAILAADVIMGHDEHCMAWIMEHRPQADEDGRGRGARGRER